jgi:hypothetical protein
VQVETFKAKPIRRGGDFDFRDTPAALMLKSGLDNRKAVGVSLRTIAKRLNYAQPTVLSHMANGRVAVPIERATQIAREVGLDERRFLAAVVGQRDASALNLLSADPTAKMDLAAEIAMIAGTSLDNLSEEQKSVIREVASEGNPERRWLTIAELPAVTIIREAKPEFRTRGLSSAILNFIQGIADLED